VKAALKLLEKASSKAVIPFKGVNFEGIRLGVIYLTFGFL